MKIVVDKMPDKMRDCPYFRDNSTMDFGIYECTYSHASCTCHNADGDGNEENDNPKYSCEYFVGLEQATSNLNQSWVEK